MINGIVIGKTECLLIGDKSQYTQSIATYDDLYRCFITYVYFNNERSQFAKVDTFPFLYSLLHQVYFLRNSGDVYVEIGEGLNLRGRVEGDVVTLALLAHDEIKNQCDMSIAQFLVSLATLISNLIDSIIEIGVNVDDCIRRFPPPLF